MAVTRLRSPPLRAPTRALTRASTPSRLLGSSGFGLCRLAAWTELCLMNMDDAPWSLLTSPSKRTEDTQDSGQQNREARAAKCG